MRFEHRFELQAPPPDVFEIFRDPTQVANFIPGASVQPPDAQGQYPAELAVSLGPKRMVFKGQLTHESSPESLSGMVSGVASATLRGARMRVDMRYTLLEAPAGTQVELISDAELGGVLADFANSGGKLVAQTIIDTFVEQLNTHFHEANTPPGNTAGAEQASDIRSPQTRQANTLSGMRLLVRSLARAFKDWIARLRPKRG